MLFVAQGESSTALNQPIENLGQLCHKLVNPLIAKFNFSLEVYLCQYSNVHDGNDVHSGMTVC